MVLLTQGSYQPRPSSGKLVPHQEKFANTSVWYDGLWWIEIALNGRPCVVSSWNAANLSSTALRCRPDLLTIQNVFPSYDSLCKFNSLLSPDRTSHHVFPFLLRLHPAAKTDSFQFCETNFTIRLLWATNPCKPSNADQSQSHRHHCCCHKKFLTCRWFNFRRFYCIKALGNFSQ